jgi:hypothetical protein
MANQHRGSETVTLVSHSGADAGWSWSCTCGASDQKRRVGKGRVVEAARRHGVKKHSYYGFRVVVDYM